MARYLREQSPSQLIGGSFKIYGNNLPTIFLIYVLPVLPVLMLKAEATVTEEGGLMVLCVLAQVVATLFATGAITVAISDVCMGNKPNVARSYRKIFSTLWVKLLLTNLLQVLVVMGGLLLLIVPGVIFGMWFMFAPVIVVLEALSGRAALKRSKLLGRDFYWRTFCIYFVTLLVATIIAFTLGVAFAALFPTHVERWTFRTFQAVIECLSAPLFLIVIILMYYDLRVRKEGYDIAMLGADLNR